MNFVLSQALTGIRMAPGCDIFFVRPVVGEEVFLDCDIFFVRPVVGEEVLCVKLVFRLLPEVFAVNVDTVVPVVLHLSQHCLWVTVSFCYFPEVLLIIL